MLFDLKHLVVSLDGFVLFLGLVGEDLKLILEDFYALLKLGQILGAVLNKVHIFFTEKFYLLVQDLASIKVILSLVILFGQVKNEELLHFQSLLCRTNLGHSRGSLSSH